MLPGASAARTRRHSPSAVSSDVFRRGSCRSDHTPDRQVRSVVKRTGAAMPAALFPVLPLPEKAAGMGYCRHEKDLPALRLYDRNHFSHLRRGSEAGRNALDSKSSYRLIAGTWVRIPPSPPEKRPIRSRQVPKCLAGFVFLFPIVPSIPIRTLSISAHGWYRPRVPPFHARLYHPMESL